MHCPILSMLFHLNVYAYVHVGVMCTQFVRISNTYRSSDQPMGWIYLKVYLPLFVVNSTHRTRHGTNARQCYTTTCKELVHGFLHNAKHLAERMANNHMLNSRECEKTIIDYTMSMKFKLCMVHYNNVST